MSRQVDADRGLYESETVLDLFRKPSYQMRMICGFLTFFSNESSGILVIYSKNRVPLDSRNYSSNKSRLQCADLPRLGL